MELKEFGGCGVLFRGTLRGSLRGLACGGPRPEKHEIFFGADMAT